ncbi:MAG TPA: DUF2059 domain-containing protein [Terriglobales bacterium]|nr:DUF2059 domain-containing protein [Terriglobales bacterium]
MRAVKKGFVLGILSLFLVCYGYAQANPQSAPATKEQVMQLLEVTQSRQRLIQYFENAKVQARLGGEQGFKQQVPNATPEQLKKADAIVDELFDGWPIDEMIDAMIPIYQKHLTQSDLDAILGFYASPAGHKLLKETPAIMAEAMQVGGEIGRRRITEVNQRIQARILELARQSQVK